MDVVIVESVGIALSVGLAGFCSGAREALSAQDSRENFAGRPPEAQAGSSLLSWWRTRRRAIQMVLRLGHRVGIVTAAIFALMLVSRFAGEVSGLAFFGLIAGLSIATVILSDLIPIACARSRPQWVSLWALRLLRLPYLLLYPLTKILLILRRQVRRVLGEDQILEEQAEVTTAMRAIFSGERPQLAQRQLLMRQATSSLKTMIREVMVPRTDMVAISQEMELEQILQVLLDCGHSRLPVFGGSLDEIVGLFYAKDLIQLVVSGQKFEIEDQIRRAHFVPETRTIDEMLEEFQRERIHMAIVVDEFGGTAGLITLEDIIEEFFGDIQDEYDVERSPLVELDGGNLLADARIGIDEIEDYFGVEFPDDPDYDSLGGFLLSMAGTVPEPGEEIRWEQLIFRVREADAKRIDSVEIEEVPAEREQAQEMVS